MTTTNKHEPGTICWVDLMSTNAEKSRDFFKALLDWTFTIGGPETGHYAMAKLGEDNVAGVGGVSPGSQFPSAWNVYFASADVDATAESVKIHGGKLLMGPMDVME